MREIICVICKKEKGNSNYIQPCQIGVEAINRASIERDCKSNLVVGDSVHVNCRKSTSRFVYADRQAGKKLTQTGKKPEVHNHHLTLK